jgi:SAM-dependent methyltransferase
MPCYNESETIQEIVSRVLASPFTAQLIVVDDGSSDGTGELLKSFDDPRMTVLEQPVNRGKGAALRRGFRHVTQPYVIVQDADLEYDPADYPIVLQPLLDGQADVVYGSRFHSSRPHRVLYFWHWVGNRLLTTVSNVFTNLNLTDMETCFKALRRQVVDSLQLDEDGFGIEPELTAKVAAGRWRIYEVGISYAGRTYEEGKKIGWRDGVRAMYCIVNYSPLAGRLRRRLARRRAPVATGGADPALSDEVGSIDDASGYADWITDLMSPHVGGDILEVGSGHGALTARLAAFGSVRASDPSPKAVARLRDRFDGDPRIKVVQADAVTAAGGATFDSIVMVNVLDHIPDDVAALHALRDALRQDGRIAVFVPAFSVLSSRFDRSIGHRRRYRRRMLALACTRAGLEVVDLRYVNSLGFIAWLVDARRLRRIPTRRWSIRLHDRTAVGMLRRVENRRSAPVGRSLLCIATRVET